MNWIVMLSRSEGHRLWKNGLVLVGVFVVCRSHKCSPGCCVHHEILAKHAPSANLRLRSSSRDRRPSTS